MATEYYIGGDDGEHFIFWNSLYDGQEVPEYSSVCTDCDEVISCNLFLENEKQQRRVVGDCCFSKYPRKASGKLEKHQHKSQSLQVPTVQASQSLQVPVSLKLQSSPEDCTDISTHFDDGKYKGYSFENVFHNDPGYMEFISGKPSEVGTAIHNASLYFLKHKDQVKPFFRFGKYRGLTFKHVKEINPGYYNFLLNSESSNERYSEAIKWYQNIKNEPTVPTIPIGKWRGATYAEVATKDVDYMKWVIRSISDQNSPLYSFFEWIRITYPDLSTSPSREKVIPQTTNGIVSNDEETIKYGKHSGKTLKQIWDEDEGYFVYMARKSTLKGTNANFNRQAIKFFIEKKGYNITDSLIIDTGKYQGKMVTDVAKENPEYFDWLQDGCRSNNESLLQAAIWWRLNRTDPQ